MDHSHIVDDIQRFPTSPGVYLMKDARGLVLYVGKAANLRTRVKSYFQDDHHDRPHISVMLEKLHHVDWIATNIETEALILEANLVRAHKPPYNVELKDDKHYPYLKITLGEPFPRLLVVRRTENDGACYFGPYTDVRAMRRLMSFAKRIFKIRDCKRALPLSRPARPCINYSIGRCWGACAAKIDVKGYRVNIENIIQFFRGRRNNLLGELRTRMHRASDQLEFEDAALLRDQMRLMENASKLQRVDLRVPDVDCDVFGLYEGSRSICLAVLHFREGLLISKRQFLFGRQRWEMSAPSRDSVLLQFYMNSAQDLPKAILVSHQADFDSAALQQWFHSRSQRRVSITIPQRGTKRTLVEMAEKNARLYLAEKMPERSSDAIIELQKVLNLPVLPETIEAFDISNLGESFAVAGMVHFVNGTPLKSAYRRYKIKSVSGQDDFAMTMEVVTRRLSRLEKEQKPFPDLLLIDGGRGQLGAAMKSLRQFEAPPMVASLAKEEEILFSQYLSQPVRLPSTDAARRLAERIRDEVHRWALSYHRTLRGKQFRGSSLEALPGVGPKTAKALLRAFGSVKRLKSAPVEDIAGIRGFTEKKARKLKQALDTL